MPSKKKPKWNITKEEGKSILSREINGFLSDAEDKRLLISDIAKILKKNISHNIKHHGKNTDLYYYIANAWGGIEQFVDKFEGLSVFIKDKKKYIMMINEETLFNEHPLNSYCGWELINIPDVKVLS